MTTQFTKDDVGKRVWSFLGGWGNITSFDIDSEYPVGVTYDNNSEDEFTVGGKLRANDLVPSLFWNEIKFENPPAPEREN